MDPVREDAYDTEEPYYEDDTIDPKLEKILKICSAVVAVIIIIGVVLIIGKFAGWWGHSGKEKDAASATTAPTATTVVAEDGQVAVPGIVGKSLEDAEQMLTDNKLHWQLKPVEADEDPNVVTDQEPAEGEMVDEGARVTIYYSQGSGVTIPDVSNKTESDAKSMIEAAKLKVGSVSEEYNNTVAKGNVISTDPVIGSSVDEGTSVNLVISLGAEGDQAVVPNLVGKKESVALERLTAAGLKSKVTYIYSDKTKGTVISQTQKSGSKVEKGSVVQYSVSLGAKAVKPTATPKKDETSYSYEGSVTVSDNPFSSPDEDPAMIKVVLTQDGKSQAVWSGTLQYDDFPKEFPIKGWSENSGTITVSKDGQTIGTYSVDFQKTAK